MGLGVLYNFKCILSILYLCVCVYIHNAGDVNMAGSGSGAVTLVSSITPLLPDPRPLFQNILLGDILPLLHILIFAASQP